MIKPDIWMLDSEELKCTMLKHGHQNKLIFAVMLKFFQTNGRYPESDDVISEHLITNLSNQLNLSTDQQLSLFENFNWETRSIERFRQEIRELLGYQIATVENSKQLMQWLDKNVLPESPTLAQCLEKAYQFFREHKLEPFSQKELKRHVRSAQHNFEKQFFSTTVEQLSEETRNAIDALLQGDDEIDSEDAVSVESAIKIKLRILKQDLAGIKLKHIQFEIKKLQHIRNIIVPSVFFKTVSRKLLQKYYVRILAMLPSNIEEYAIENRYATMAIFCYIRSQLLTDNLIDLFLKSIHKVEVSAGKHIDKKILSGVKKINGKFDILYTLADTNAEHPKGVIEEQVYPKVSQDKLRDLAKELRCKGKWYQTQVHVKMRSLYSHAHRKELLMLLDTFDFHSNNQEGKILLQAIEFIKQHRDAIDKYYPDSQLVPIDGVIYDDWRPSVIEQQQSDNPKENKYKVEQMNYEMAVLELLHKQLTCKTIWVEGGYHYRNPDEDMPKDWENKREYYYNEIKAKLNADDFIDPLKDFLEKNLRQLNDTILSNEKVKILDKNGGHIKLTPYEAQKEPANIKTLKREINHRWPSINLIDILKEADFRIGFTKQFHTVASRGSLDNTQLTKRLLLCMYALGSNTGLKRISSANKDASYSALRYVKRRHITVDNVKAAVVDVINKILEIRDPKIWGDITVGCGCDSTQVSSWDQNLIAEWHVRYHEPGVMIYCHADKYATCVYSQLKTCSSSEVGSMIRGVLRHDTKMNMDKAYVDTHGQSTIGFAFSHLLGFDLLPRLKNLNRQKLYYSSAKHKNNYPNLEAILKTSVNWDSMKESYDEVIKHAVALKLGTVDPDVLIKRFSKDNYTHPVYKALTEIGHVIKTIFLCKYLMSEELRIEIHEALNVIESLNSIMGFIFYGKLGEISTNIKEEQKLAIACLHLLQVCMSYINTLIIQATLPDSGILLTPEDKRALTTLFHAHINPYGLFPLDLSQRLII